MCLNSASIFCVAAILGFATGPSVMNGMTLGVGRLVFRLRLFLYTILPNCHPKKKGRINRSNRSQQLVVSGRRLGLIAGTVLRR